MAPVENALPRIRDQRLHPLWEKVQAGERLTRADGLLADMKGVCCIAMRKLECSIPHVRKDFAVASDRVRTSHRMIRIAKIFAKLFDCVRHKLPSP